MRRIALALVVVGGLGEGTAVAEELHVTVYNNNLALVKETRSVELPKGRGEFSFMGVPQQIDPTSVRLNAPGGRFSLLEQNYRYDLVNRAKLLERYLDHPARIITKHDKLHEGILKTASGGMVLETADGVVLLNDDEIADITLPEIPEGLITRPTLVWGVENGGDARRDVEIAYLTGGIQWHAEYVAAVDKDDKKMNLSGWVSIENNSGGTYKNAHLKVVAGDVHRAPAPGMPRGGRGVEMMMAKDAGFEERSFFEYHIYDLGRTTTIADREIKQIRLIEDREVPVVKKYVYEPTRDAKVQVRLEFQNKESAGLGIPLPGGMFRVYREDADGALEFAGEDRIDHTARDEEVSTFLGSAFDLVGERAELENNRVVDRVQEQRVEIKLRNRKEKGSVRILVREHPGGDWEVLESTHKHERPNARDLEFEVEVPVGKEIVINYRVRSRY
jgi:hypothetical protein